MKKELLDILLKVQKDLPVVKKDADGYNYRFASLPQVWKQIKDTITSNGFFITHSVNSDGVETTAWHEQGELKSFIPFTGDGMKPQEVGSEITYWKRYSICAIFNVIVEGDDDDAQSSQDAKKVPRTASTPQSGTNVPKTCKDCGKPEKMRVNGSGSYCAGRYNNSCPPKQMTEDDKRISDEIDSWPEPIPTITIDDIK